MNPLIALLALLSLVLFSCGSLEKEITIDLDDYESRLVVEAYLEPGKPYKLLLSRSADFFAPIDIQDPIGAVLQQLESGANVRIVHGGDTSILDNQLVFDDANRQFSNYVSSDTVPFVYGEAFHLFIETNAGERAFATTVIPEPLPIDSVVIQNQPGDTLFRVLTYYTDNPDEANYVRRILHINTLDSIEQDFITDDRFVDSPSVVFGTGYSYSSGDTLINSLYHLDESYYEFLRSLFGALDANGNPFAQPGLIRTNLTGTNDPTGIFTGLTYDRIYTVIP